MSRMRVTRVLIYEGDEQWIDTTLQASLVSEGKTLYGGDNNSIREQERVVEWLKVEDVKKNG